MARILPLLVILLIGSAIATKSSSNTIRDRDLPPGPRRRVMALRKELNSFFTPACDRLLHVIREIQWARMCLYNGLSFPEYRKLLAVCKNRSETLDALRVYRKKCRDSPSFCNDATLARLMQERVTAVKACTAIGWDGPRNCPDLSAFKAEYARTRNACNGKEDRVKQIRDEIKAVKTNFAKPSAEPVARFVE